MSDLHRSNVPYQYGMRFSRELHAELRSGEKGCNVVLEQEPPLLQFFEHFIRGGLIFGFDAPNVPVDLVVGGGKPLELVAGFR
jgi:hypothetical protein